MANQETLEYLQKVTGMVYSEEQSKLISCEEGACVLACAGSGKTTAMTHLIARRLLDKTIRTGRRILGVTYSKVGAGEMDDRLEALLDLIELNATVKMKTVHACCLEFLKDIGAMRGRTVLDHGKAEILQELGRKVARGWKYEDGEQIASLITLQRGSLKSRSSFITSIDFRCTGIESNKYLAVYDAYKQYKAENNLIDFDDMLLLAYYKLKNTPLYAKDFMERYDCVLVDEAQDMSLLQHQIIYQMLGKSAVSPEEHDDHVRKTLVLIGDDDQCIFEWMGSEPDGLSNAMDGYRLPLYTLSTNYRCPANVLSAAARGILHNEHSVPKAMNAYKPNGTLQYLSVQGGFACESEYVAKKIQAQLEEGISPSSIAVLARNGVHLSLVWLYLSCYGIKSRMFGGQSSGPDALIKHICGCFHLHESTADAGNVLYALIGGNKKNSEKLSNLINMVDGSFKEWMEFVLSTYVPVYGVKAEEDNSYVTSGKMWKDAMREFYFSGGLSNGNAVNNIYELYKSICETPRKFYLSVLAIYRVSMGWKYKGDDNARIFGGTLSALERLLKTDAEMVLPVLLSINKYKAPNKNYVVLSTAHSAKGREWNTVYMVCDDTLAFPSQISLSVLAETGDVRAVKQFIEAERRLHYVAMTRAKDTLCVIGGEEASPGRYLREALGKDI